MVIWPLIKLQPNQLWGWLNVIWLHKLRIDLHLSTPSRTIVMFWLIVAFLSMVTHSFTCLGMVTCETLNSSNIIQNMCFGVYLIGLFLIYIHTIIVVVLALFVQYSPAVTETCYGLGNAASFWSWWRNTRRGYRLHMPQTNWSLFSNVELWAEITLHYCYVTMTIVWNVSMMQTSLCYICPGLPDRVCPAQLDGRTDGEGDGQVLKSQNSVALCVKLCCSDSESWTVPKHHIKSADIKTELDCLWRRGSLTELLLPMFSLSSLRV